MPDTRVTCTAGSWTLVVDGCTTDVSVMLASDTPVYLRATASGAGTPSEDRGPLELIQRGDGWSEATILEKFPGTATAADLYAKPFRSDVDAVVGVSYTAD